MSELFHAVCIGLIWDSECPEVEQITQLLDCIDPVLRLHEVSSFLHVFVLCTLVKIMFVVALSLI